MKIIFYLAHPAHFHLFLNPINKLLSKGISLKILIKKKDILEDLLNEKGIDYSIIAKKERKDGFLGIMFGVLKRSASMLKYIIKFRPDLIVSSSTEFGLICKVTGVKNIAIYEDDLILFPIVYKYFVPFTDVLVCPKPCNNGKWNYKTIHYAGYNELAYLHPGLFKPDRAIAEKYISLDNPYFIIRFAKLTAWHDDGVRGIDAIITEKLITMLEPHGRILITSEKKLDPHLEKFRMNINPLDIHHVMAFATLFIGDSQTMAAEAGVLGVPFLRFNDFVGKLGYLDELENKYRLGFGVRPNEVELLFNKINELLNNKNLKYIFEERRQKMLSEKIRVTDFITWFLADFPKSFQILQQNLEYQYIFN